MSSGDFVLGLVVLAAVVVPLTLAGRRLRATWFPCVGPLALLADVVVTLVLVVVVGEAVGTVGRFDRLGLVVGSALTTVIVRWLTPPPTVAVPVEETPAPRSPRWEWLLAAGLVTVVAAQWSSHVVLAGRHGVTDFDSMAYHLPVAARFVQLGSTTHLALLAPDPFVATAYHGESTELLHALGMVAWGGRDLLSPFLNMGWLALALFSGWCTGRRFGVGPLATAAVGMVVSVPVLASSNAGTARADIASIALLLAATAFLVHIDLDRAVVASGLAAGLAVGSKENALAIATALLVVAVVAVPRGRRVPAALWWSSGAVVAGGYWFLRNLARTGNPVPTMRLGIGPLRLPGPDLPSFRANDRRALDYLTDTSVLREVFVPGMRAAFGNGRALLAIALAAALLVAAARRGLPRRLAAVAVVGLAAYLVTPFTAWGPAGSPNPLLVAANFRYAIGGLALAAVAGSLAVAGRARVRSVALLLVAATIILTELSRHSFPVWRLAGPERVGLILGTGVALAVARWVRRLGGVRPRLGVAALLLAAVAVGPTVATWHLRHRYGPDSGVGSVVATAGRELEGTRIGIAGLQLPYPLHGPTLANRVVYVGRALPHGGLVDHTSCPEWRQAVNDGHFDYVLVSAPESMPGVPIPPQSSWTATDPGADLVAGEGKAALYRITAALDPLGCPPP